MPDDPSWPTEDGDADQQIAPEQPTVQVKRPVVDQPTMRIPITRVRNGAPVARPQTAPQPAVRTVTNQSPPRPEPPVSQVTASAPPPFVPPSKPADSEPADEETHAEPERFEPVKRSRKPLAIIGSLVVVALLGAAGVYAVNEFGGPPAVTTQPPAPAAAVRPMVKAVGTDAPVPTPAGVKSALTGPLGAAALGTVSGSVVDPATGTVLFQQGDTTPGTPASSLKVLTAAAALLELDPAAQLSTKVVSGPAPGTVVLVGGGDPTLSSFAAGKSTVYPGAATLDDLAAQVKAKGPVTQVLVDLGRYSGDPMAQGWDNLDIAGGSITPIVPVMMDGGRADPTNPDGARTATPAQAVADALAQRLGVGPATVGTAPQGAQPLGEVKSAPIGQLVDNMMQISDNVLAEAIAREVARVTGNEQSFTGSTKAVRDVLTKHGFTLTGLEMADGSGLSTRDKLPPKLLTDILAAAAKPGQDDKTAKLRPLLTSLPVAGGSGTLAKRYKEGAASGKGWVRAKTGTLTGINALAGVVVDADGRLLVFSFLAASNEDKDVVRAALDVLAATLRGCGCS